MSNKIINITIFKGLYMKKIFFENKKNICGDRIRLIRQINKMSQKELAIKMQIEGVIVEQDVISRIENGQRIVTDYELLALSKIFNTSADWILGIDS